MCCITVLHDEHMCHLPPQHVLPLIAVAFKSGCTSHCMFNSNSYTEYETRALRTISHSVGNSVFSMCIISLIQLCLWHMHYFPNPNTQPRLRCIPSMRRSYDVRFVPKVDYTLKTDDSI